MAKRGPSRGVAKASFARLRDPTAPKRSVRCFTRPTGRSERPLSARPRYQLA